VLSPKHSRCVRGYEVLGEQTLDEHSRPDLKGLRPGSSIADRHAREWQNRPG